MLRMSSNYYQISFLVNEKQREKQKKFLEQLIAFKYDSVVEEVFHNFYGTSQAIEKREKKLRKKWPNSFKVLKEPFRMFFNSKKEMDEMHCIKCGQPFQGKYEEYICPTCSQKDFQYQQQLIENAQGKCILCGSSENLNEERALVIGGTVDICNSCIRKVKGIKKEHSDKEKRKL